MTLPLYGVYGASGCGRGIMPLARTQLREKGVPLDRLVFIDDAPATTSINGHEIVTLATFLGTDASRRYAVIAVADGAVRAKISAALTESGVNHWSVRAANLVIMDDVEIGEGAALSPFVTLTSNIRIGRHFHANLYSYVEHDCLIGDFVTFAPGVKCNGNVVI
jgi:acetyltransferase-like isoleucine patch superfamily enzyme